jgi:AcrR family transcriptional regulator
MPRPAAAQSATTRTALLDAAERLLARTGYRKITMDDLAQEAGLSRRTVYVYFRSKDEVVLGTIDRIVDRVSERLETLARGPGTAQERLGEMLVERVRIRVESVRDYAHALDGIFAGLRPAYLERRRGYFEAEAAQLAKVLREGIREGALQRRDVRATSQLLVTATNALLPHGLSPAQLLDVEATLRQARALAQLLVGGLRAPIPAPRLARRSP